MLGVLLVATLLLRCLLHHTRLGAFTARAVFSFFSFSFASCITPGCSKGASGLWREDVACALELAEGQAILPRCRLHQEIQSTSQTGKVM